EVEIARLLEVAAAEIHRAEIRHDVLVADVERGRTLERSDRALHRSGGVLVDSEPHVRLPEIRRDRGRTARMFERGPAPTLLSGALIERELGAGETEHRLHVIRCLRDDAPIQRERLIGPTGTAQEISLRSEN